MRNQRYSSMRLFTSSISMRGGKLNNLLKMDNIIWELKIAS